MKTPLFMLLQNKNWNAESEGAQQELLEGLQEWPMNPLEEHEGVSLVGALASAWNGDESQVLLLAIETLIQRGCSASGAWRENLKTISQPLTISFLEDFERPGGSPRQWLQGIELMDHFDNATDAPKAIASSIADRIQDFPEGWSTKIGGVPVAVWLLTHSHLSGRGGRTANGSASDHRVLRKKRQLAFFQAAQKSGGFPDEGALIVGAAALAGASVNGYGGSLETGEEEVQHGRMKQELFRAVKEKKVGETKGLVEAFLSEAETFPRDHRRVLAHGLLAIASQGLREKTTISTRAAMWELAYAGFECFPGQPFKEVVDGLLFESLAETTRVACDWATRPGGHDHVLRAWLATRAHFTQQAQTARKHWLDGLEQSLESQANAGVVFSEEVVNDLEKFMPDSSSSNPSDALKAEEWGRAWALVSKARLNNAWSPAPPPSSRRPRM